MLHALNIISLIGEVVFGIMIIITFFNLVKLKNFIRDHITINITVMILTFIGFLRFVIIIIL